MNPEQLQQIINWLNLEIERLNLSINEADKTNNYGRKTQYEGMRDAFVQFLKEVSNTKKEKVKPITKNIRTNI
ncbi:MAG: hypothetical protein Q7W13_00930 [Bacteroidia bacterium]|nr:hypothetical protein [Bacteroidia bacterium]